MPTSPFDDQPSWDRADLVLPQGGWFSCGFLFTPDLVLTHCKCINYINKMRFCVLVLFVYLCLYLHLLYEFSI